MIAAGLLYLGLFALAAAMSRHAPVLLAPGLARNHEAGLRRAGAVLVAMSLAAALIDPDWPRALVTWFGLAPLAAGIIVLGLSYMPWLARAGALLGAGLVLGGVAALVAS